MSSEGPDLSNVAPEDLPTPGVTPTTSQTQQSGVYLLSPLPDSTHSPNQGNGDDAKVVALELPTLPASSASSADTLIEMPSTHPQVPDSGSSDAASAALGTEGEVQVEGDVSRPRWTMKGLFSSIKEKVQEPSDHTAPVGKFYFDSVNMFQGLHDLSDSSEDDDGFGDQSPRSHTTGSESDRHSHGLTSFLGEGDPPPRLRSKKPRRSSDAASSAPKTQPDLSASSPDVGVHNFVASDGNDTQGGAVEPNQAGFGAIRSLSLSALPKHGSSRPLGDELHVDWSQELEPLELEPSEEHSSFLPDSADHERRHDRRSRGTKSKWYHRLWRQVKRQQTWVFLLILGLVAALVGLAMEETMHQLIAGRNELAKLSDNYFVSYLLWVVFAMASCALATLLVHFVAPYSAGSGIPAVKSILSGVMLEHYLSFRTLIVKVMGLICVYAAGMFVGKEGPYVHISTALAAQLARLPFFGKIQRNEGLKLQLFAAGCAAGVAVTFGAPIGGVIFSIEVTTTYYLIQNLSKGFFCAIVATLFIYLMDTHGLIAFFSTDFAPSPYTSTELLVFSLIGISFGLLGVLFNFYVKKVAQLRRNYKILNQSRYGQVLIIAAISGLVTFPILPLRTGPTSVLNDLFSTSPLTNWQNPNIYFVLSAVVILEFIMCGISLGLPIPCGLYTPMFILGAALGRLIGEVLHAVHLLPSIVPAGYAVVGAAAFAAATTRTLSSSIICFELTRQLEHLLPVLLAVLIASAVGNFFGPSIYDELLKMKGLPYMPPFSSTKGGNKTAKSIMRRDVIFLTTESTYEDLQTLLINSHYSSFPLVQTRKQRTLLGVLPRSTLERLLDTLESRLLTLAQKQVEYLNMSILDHQAQQEQLEVRAEDPAAPSSASDAPPPPPSTPSTIEPKFKSRFGGMAASLHLAPTDATDEASPERQKLEEVMHELTEQAMHQQVGLSRSTPGLDAGPFQLPVQTPHSKVHFLFAMLGLKCGYILDQGSLVGVITKRDLISLQ